VEVVAGGLGCFAIRNEDTDGLVDFSQVAQTAQAWGQVWIQVLVNPEMAWYWARAADEVDDQGGERVRGSSVEDEAAVGFAEESAEGHP
jgi:hypothetical protein